MFFALSVICSIFQVIYRVNVQYISDTDTQYNSPNKKIQKVLRKFQKASGLQNVCIKSHITVCVTVSTYLDFFSCLPLFFDKLVVYINVEQ